MYIKILLTMLLLLISGGLYSLFTMFINGDDIDFLFSMGCLFVMTLPIWTLWRIWK